jgi:hypothetical protein
MKKNILVLLLTVGLLALNGGCTSKESQEQDQTIENADVEKIETIDSVDTPADAGEVAATETPPAADAPPADDASLEASLNDPAMSSEPPPPEVATNTPTIDETSLAGSDAAPVTDAQLAPDPALTADASTTSTEITETPVVDTSMSMADPVQPTPVAKPASGGSPLLKISGTTPYQAKDGGWINTVYIARPGEKLADISQKIYDADKTKELKAIKENSYLKWRAPRGGDKIYYVSRGRPDDSTRTLTYYEDLGMVPETYVAKKGDNLKKVAKELLGYDGAWKEIWTSNEVESKVTLKEGETIRYWKTGGEVMAMAPPSPPPGDSGGATVMDSSQAPQPTAMTTPPPTDTASLPPPPADSGASLPPPPDASAPPVDPMAAATTDTAVPPPPTEDAPPPPPPPVEDGTEVAAADGAKKDLDEAAAEEEEGGVLNNDAMMSMAALGVLVALLAFVIIRKKKQKSQMNNLEMNA